MNNTYSVREISIESGYSRDTVSRKFKARKIKPDADGRYPLRDILLAFTGDYKAARTRETEARAELLEMDASQQRSELVSLAEVNQWMNETFQPIRERFRALPAECCNRCNPTDPELARAALESWVSDAVKMIRSAFPPVPNDGF